MLVVFLDVECYSSGDLNASQEVLIPENEEDLARLLVLLSEHFVVYNGEVLIAVRGLRRFGASLLLLFEQAVTERKDVPIELDDEHREIDVGQVEVDELKLGLLLPYCGFLRLLSLWVLHG